MTSWIQPTTPRSLDDRHRESFVDLFRTFHQRQHRQTLEQLRRARRLLELGFGGAQERRRAEDRIRLERHDSCAVTIKAGKRVGSDDKRSSSWLSNLRASGTKLRKTTLRSSNREASSR
jgi:hypothetical protein